MRRHKNLTIKQPEATSSSRISDLSKERVIELFDLLVKTFDENEPVEFLLRAKVVSAVQRKPRKMRVYF
jgi:hypothetical protein